MKLGDLSALEITNKTSSNKGIKLDIGPFTIRLRSRNKKFIQTFRNLYYYFPVAKKTQIVDFHIDMLPPNNHRRWLKPQIHFCVDGHRPFTPFSLSHTMPLFEWGLNWCIVHNSNHYLMMHAAVLEKNEKCLLLPAIPGSGKSTLAAALSFRGWRFLSDEFCLIKPSNGHIDPIPRPTPLKNESIQIIRDFAPDAFIGPLFLETRKGTIGHLRSPAASIEKQSKSGKPKWIIFPKYQEHSDVLLTPIEKSSALFKLALNSFNYELQGETGFKLTAKLVNECDCFDLTYGNLDEVIVELNNLANNA